jgi:hypothetical protein
MLMNEVMNKQLLYHYGHNLCFSYSNAVFTPMRNVNQATIQIVLTKDRIYNQKVRNCLSNISVLLLLLLLLFTFFY